MKPSVTAIIAVHNHEKYVAEALLSVLNQTVLPSYIIVVDDASKDKSLKKIEGIITNNKLDLKVITNQNQLGTAKTYNLAIGKVKSDYYFILDGDDYIKNDYIEKTTSVLSLHENISIVYTDLEFIGERAKIAYYKSNEDYWANTPQRYILNFPDFNKDAFDNLTYSNFIHNASLCRTESVLSAGVYKPTKKRAIDHDLFIRILSKGHTAYHIAEPLLFYRQHSKNQFNNQQISTFKSIREEEAETMEFKLNELNAKLRTIKASRFYRLWRKFNSVKERVRA